MKQPWLKFHPTDWRADPALRSCSLAAWGLWIEIICIMHESDPYGALLIGGRPPSHQQLAKVCGQPVKEVTAALAELERAGVFSIVDGVIISRRMQRDREKADEDKANGKRGGNPRLKVEGLTPPREDGDKARVRVRSQSQIQKKINPDANHHQPSTQSDQPMLTPEASAIAASIGKSAGFTKETWPVGWCGAAMRVQRWLTEGCPGHVVEGAAIAVLRRKRDGPPETFAYFDRPIAQAWADLQRPMPTAAPTQDAANGTHRKRTAVDASKDFVADIDRRIREIEADQVGGGTGDVAARLLPSE